LTQGSLFEDVAPQKPRRTKRSVEILREPVGTPRPEGWEPDAPPDLSRAGDVRIGFDTETTGLNWHRGDRPVGCSIAWRDGNRIEARYLGWGHRDGNSMSEDAAIRWLQSQEGLLGKFILALNAPFDAHHSRVLLGRDLASIVRRMGDVGHRAAILEDTRREFSLEAIAQDYLGQGKVKGLRMDLEGGASRYAGWEITPYGRQDAALLVQLDEVMAPLIERDELQAVVDLEDDVLPVTIEMEKNGARLDVPKLNRWVAENAQRIEEARSNLRRLIGRSIDAKSQEQVESVFHQLGIPLYQEVLSPRGERVPRPEFADPKTGRLSFTDEILAKVGIPETEALRELVHALDFNSKFLAPYHRSTEADGILRFSLHQLRSERGGDFGGTCSGRFSCSALSRTEGANIQQVPEAVKELFIPEDGQLLVSADAEQIEYRVFAEVAALLGNPRMLEMYLADPLIDFHDDVTGPIVRRLRPDFDRRRTKTCNFMNLFGGGIKKHARMLGVDLREGKAIVEAYRRALPEAQGSLKWMSNRAKKNGFVKTLLGRRARFFPCPKHEWNGAPVKASTGEREYCGSCPKLHSALNRAVQGSAADVNKEKLVDLYRERERIGLRMRMTIHDDAVGDVPSVEAACEVARVLNRQPVRTKLRVKILWDTRYGPNWHDLCPKRTLLEVGE